MKVAKLARRKTLQENIYQVLKDALMNGDIAPGKRLTVREISEQFDVSAMPVREAVRRLASEGALEVLPNGSCRVQVLSAEEREQIRCIRLALETLALQLAAEKISKTDIRDLEQILKDLKTALGRADIEACENLNKRFHFTLYRASDAPILVDTIENVWMRHGPFLRQYLRLFLDKDKAKAKHLATFHHEALVKALRQGNLKRAIKALQDDLGQPDISYDMLVTADGAE